MFFVFIDAFNAYDNGIRAVSGANATAGLFATYPQEFLSTTSAFANEVNFKLRSILIEAGL